MRAGPSPEGPRPDEFGGVASTHILVKLKSDAHQRVRMANQEGLADSDPRNQLSERFRATADAWQVVRMSPLYGGRFADPALAARYGLDCTYIIDVPRGTDTPVMAASFAAIGEEVESAGYDSVGGVASGEIAETPAVTGGVASSQVIPDDPEFPFQWGMHNTGQTINGQAGTPDADIDAPEAWAIHTGNLGTVTVAIINSGLASHIEYGDNAAPFPNGRVLQGYNTVLGTDDPADLGDTCPFGTQVTGTIGAAGNNGQGIAGMTWGVYLMPVKVLSGCSGNVTDLIEGILWAADHGADVIDMGLNYNITDPAMIAALQSAVDYAHDRGAVLVAAVGQSSFPCGPVGSVCYPARADHVIGVSGTDQDDLFDAASRFGPGTDVAAPDIRIRTTTWSPGYYTFQSGTGMASAHVSGLAALIKSYAPFLTNDQIAEIIQQTANDLGPSGWDDHFGYGRINAGNALIAVLPGACCDLLSGTCADGVFASDCSGTHQSWTEDAACVDVSCEAVSGACCNHDPFGACTDGVTIAACGCLNCEWVKRGSCSEMDCSHTAIPTVSEWGVVVFTLLLLIGAKVFLSRPTSLA